MRNRRTVAAVHSTRQARLGLTMVIGLGAFVLAASPAVAQVAEMPKIKAGQTVWATRADGATIKGKVMSIAAAGLELKDQERVTSLTLGDIRRVETRDSLKNGAIIGAIPTALLFGLGAGAVSAYDCMLSYGCTDTANGDALKGALVGAAIGALIGAGIDRLIPGRRVLYRSPASRAAALSLAPTASARSAGVGITLGW